MYPLSKQWVKLYGTTKTHKFKDIKEITKEHVIFWPIIDQTGTMLLLKLYPNILNTYVKKRSL